ncbi:sensor histidine kinase [Maridesulfovibrio zosterae]|uniref:sensor histidine kinase n=1 Tax=Maridesulfovibrio zosterae TaxID=82171 RepID=UPI0004263064|nr:ATP-binding protein [Maridesulfovibrio zosterae]
MKISSSIRILNTALAVVLLIAAGFVWESVQEHHLYSRLAQYGNEIEINCTEISTLFTELVSLKRERAFEQIEKRFDTTLIFCEKARLLNTPIGDRYLDDIISKLSISRKILDNIIKVRKEQTGDSKIETFENISVQFFINSLMLLRSLHSAKNMWADAMTASFEKLLLLLIGFAVLLITVLCTMAYYLQRAVIKPVSLLYEATNAIASGDITYRVPDFSAKNELFALRESFNLMTENIEINQSKLKVEIAEKEKTQEALLSESYKLKSSNEQLEQFAYVASHDLQEPLRIIVSYMQLLSRRYGDKFDEDGKRFMDGAVNGAERMRSLIRALLQYSRLNTQANPFEDISGDDVLESALENLEHMIEERDAVIVQNGLPELHGDYIQLTQLFQNLISNGIKFQREGEQPRISVSALKKENQWVFSVQDNGIGIEKEYGEKVFKLFQRLHSRGSYEGTGIGLSICQRIVERHGGRIWFDSIPDQGTIFYFTLNTGEVNNGK